VRDIVRVVIAAAPLLVWAWLGSPAPAALLAWALVVGAAALTFWGPAPAAAGWALVLWLYATPVLGFLREEPSLTLGAGLLFVAGGFRAASHQGLPPAGSATVTAACAALTLALVGVTPQGAHPPELGIALFSSRLGLLFHWPVLWAGVLGLALARGPALAASAGGLLVLLGAAACLPESRPDAWLLALPFLATGLVASLEALRRLAATRPLALLSVAACAAVVWNLLFMRLYRDEGIPRDDTVSFAQVVEGNARLLAEGVGSPVAWPANWAFAAWRDLSPARFDLMVGKELPARDDRLELDVGRLDLDEALLAEGWSVRHPCGEQVCREVDARARLFLPLPDGEWRALVVTAGGAGRLLVSVNGQAAGSLVFEGPGTEAFLATGAGQWRRGVNEVTLEAPEGPVLVDRLAASRGQP
jgi:hypothetical protein